MRHRHTRIENNPVSHEKLCIRAKEYCSILSARITKNRIDDSKPNNSKYGFNIPKVVAACTSNTFPYIVCRGRNNNTLQKPHPTLKAAYPPLRPNGTPNNQSLPGVKYYYPAGHCAEPHAAHILLYNMDNIRRPITINDIWFSLAYDVKNQAVVPYCGTCRLTFPQLK